MIGRRAPATLDLEERLSKLIGWTKQVLADASLKERIRSDVAEGMEKTQREFLLRQQLEAIKKQLNEGGSDVVSTYRERVATARMPARLAASMPKGASSKTIQSHAGKPSS